MKRLLHIVSVLIVLFGTSASLFAQDNGNQMDVGKHKGHYKHRGNRGLHRGQVERPVRLRTSRSRVGVVKHKTTTERTQTSTQAPK